MLKRPTALDDEKLAWIDKELAEGRGFAGYVVADLLAEVRRLREQQQAIQNNLRAIMIIDRGPEPASLRHLDTMQIVRSMLVKEEEGEPIRARDLS